MRELVYNIFSGSNFVGYVGMAYICLGAGILSGVQIDTIYLTCLSITAALLAMADMLTFSENLSDNKQNRRWFTALLPSRRYIRYRLNVSACAFMVVIPYAPFLRTLNEGTLGTLGNAATFISLGITIKIIGDKSGRSLMEYIDKLKEIQDKNDHLDKITNQHLDRIMDVNNKLLEQLNAKNLEIDELKKKLDEKQLEPSA